MTDVLLASAVATALLSTVHVMSIALAVRAISHTASAPDPRDTSPGASGVTLVRPLCGIDFQAEALLRANFVQSVKPFELIFCIASQDDPVVPLLQRIVKDYPEIEARILFGDAQISSNPKLNNMAKGWSAARYDTVIFADSNLMIPADYCERVCAAFGAKTAVVSAPPVGSEPASLWADVECAMLNTHAARWQYAAAAIGRRFAQGKTLAFRRSRVPQNLMYLLAEEPAEDAAVTKLMRRVKGDIAILAPPFDHPVGPRSLSQVWKRHTRWAKLRRATFPVMFAGEIFTGIVPSLVAFGITAWLADIILWPALLIFSAAWYIPEVWMASRLGWTLRATSPLAWLLRDLMLPIIYVTAWLSDEFVWNGHRMTSARPVRDPF